MSNKKLLFLNPYEITKQFIGLANTDIKLRRLKKKTKHLNNELMDSLNSNITNFLRLPNQSDALSNPHEITKQFIELTNTDIELKGLKKKRNHLKDELMDSLNNNITNFLHLPR